jgi:cytochrome c-type biogenesis protein CcmH
MLALYFLAILSGAGLAFAWHLVMPPVLAQVSALARPRVAWSFGRLKAVMTARPTIAVLLLLPFAGVAAAFYLSGAAREAGGSHDALLERAREEAPHDLNKAVAELEARLKTAPDDIDGWRLLSRSYALLGEPQKASKAAARAAALEARSGDADAQSAAGEDLVTANDDKVVPAARRLFEAALKADPRDPRARFYMGLAAAQDGHGDEALQRWLALEADSPADAPWREGLRTNIDRLAAQLGMSAADLARRRAALAAAEPAPPATAPAPAAAAIPGPSAADVAAAAKMSSDDRAAMIRAMVQRLADRLAQEPGNVDGWMRLGRAYDVLGEKQKSLDAYRHATEADPKRADARAAYANALSASGAASRGSPE